MYNSRTTERLATLVVAALLGAYGSLRSPTRLPCRLYVPVPSRFALKARRGLFYGDSREGG